MPGLPKETKMSKPAHRGALQAWGKWLLLLNAAVPAVSTMQTVSVVDFCGQTLHGDGMVLTSHRDSRRYYFVVASTDCQLTMQAATPKDKVQFQFRFFLVYSMVRSPSSTLASRASNDHPTLALPKSRRERETPDPCTAGSYVQFYDGQNHTAKPLGMPLCGKNIPRPVISTSNFLTLRLVTRGQQPRVDFVGDFTSIRTGSPTLLPPLNNADASSAVNALPSQVTCAGPQESQLLPPGTATWDKTDKRKPILASLAAILGAAFVFWCCWNPGWFIWRMGACRYLPGCNSVCAACHLCPRSCTHRKPPKVTPHGSTEPPV
ncbi:low-density lipoprotein receptor class A domain-containing protein 2 isoform X2 [Podarcis raffonei]|uniref:low-density lipoprotein receptor class A domain-containing protein 2 isoform X2 n=1 Tax=Podarcis raffonei TaxID=65483 RepID=UPI0023290F08|nr:low-density lipoprotein receptor class A domain-containing protein 2 isoform X2 [Podarcis raffonei]